MSLFIGAVFVLGCMAFGRLLLKPIAAGLEPEERWIFSSGLGLALLSYGILAIGLSGSLNPSMLRIAAGLLIVAALFEIKSLFLTLRDFAKKNFSIHISDWFILILSSACLIAVIAGILAPETANDSLCYHLHLPKIYLAQHRIAPVPYEVNSHFPFFMEMLYTFALGIQGSSLAKFFHLATGALSAAALFIFMRKQAGARAAATASLIYITVPGIFNQLGTTYIDAGLAFYTFLALWTALRWRETRKTAYLILCGAFCGCMMSIKYLALLSILAFGIYFLADCFKRGERAKIGFYLLVFTATAFLFGGYWYLRAYIETGNPVFPYFYSIFKAGDPTIHYDDIGVGHSPFAFLLLPWTMTMHPEKFEGFGVQIGPAFLIYLPVWLLGIKDDSRKKLLAAYVLFYLFFWFVLAQSLRFFYPALPALACLSAYAIADTHKRVPRISALIAAAILFLHTGLGVFHYRRDFKVAAGRESEREYLMKYERTALAADYVNTRLPAKSKILAADEAHGFYFKKDIVREIVYADKSGYARSASSLDDVFESLKRDGFTHLLITSNKKFSPPENIEPMRLPALFRTRENELAQYVLPLYTYTFASPEGDKTRYQIFKIR